MILDNLKHAPVLPEHIRLTRRRFLALSSSFVATVIVASCGGTGDDQATSDAPTRSPEVGQDAPAAASETPNADGAAISLDQFMQLSRVLTAFDDLDDTASGEIYLNALLTQRDLRARLAQLWTAGGFGNATPPATVADLEARGVHDTDALAELADTITRDWYSGAYTVGDEMKVATYTNALAWRTLGYRQGGPSSCGGGFGHWASVPAA